MKLNWKKVFNWDIAGVEGPVDTCAKDGRVSGYSVIVRYVHHGAKNLFFDVESESLYSQYGDPETAARNVAEYYRRKMTHQRIAAAIRQK